MAAILRWMFVMVLLILVAGGGAAWWLYSRSDEGLRQIVLDQLKAAAPDLRFSIARTHFDVAGRVRIYGLVVYQPDDDLDRPSIEIPEVIATFEDFENLVIQKLYVVKPKVRLVRDPNGQWNIPKMPPQQSGAPSLPEVEIEHATILTAFQLPDHSVRKLIFRNFNVSARPADARRLSVQVATEIEPVGSLTNEIPDKPAPLTLDIDAHLDGSRWAVSSHEPWQVQINSKLIRMLSDLSPELSAHVARAGRLMDASLARQSAAAASVAVPGSSPPAELPVETSTEFPDFGVNCTCNLNFFVKKPAADQPLGFEVKADLANGEVNNPLLPFPLNKLSGTIYVDNRQIIVRNARAANGPTEFGFDGKIVPSTPMTATLKVRNVDLNNAVKLRLPDPLRKVVLSLGLTGICNADATVTEDSGKWIPKVDLRLTQGTVKHERFPVTVRDVNGKLKMENDCVEFDATGRYAGQDVKAYGTVINPGPAHHARVIVTGNNLPMDDESIAACPAQIRSAIAALRIKGRHDFLLEVHRPAGLGQKYDPTLNERVYQASCSFKDFPYAVEQLEGNVKWNGDLVEFTSFSGVHDGARLTGHGEFRRSPGPGQLNMFLNAVNAAFDKSLEAALPPTLRQVWSQFQPAGNFDAKAEVTWSPGRPCVVRLPNVMVRDGRVSMTCFPWSLESLEGQFAYNTEETKPEILIMNRVHAKHDDSVFTARGSGWFPKDNPWRLDFDELSVDNLIPNATFRNALPEGLRKIFDSLRPEGTYSFYGPVSFFGPRRRDQPISATWKLKSVLSRCAIFAGSQIEEVNGVAKLDGTWDGFAATLDGKLDLDSLRVFRQPSGQAYQITKVTGPISFRNNRFVAGYEKRFAAGVDDAVPPRESDAAEVESRIRGNAIDGTVFLDAVADFASETTYRAFVELRSGLLERYAQQYYRGHSKLAGVMNGWINIRGKSTGPDRLGGEGRLIIAPAALIDMPLIAQVFQLVQLQSPDKTAFEQAELNFTVNNERFSFNSIELQGNSVRMGGYGYVRFDGGMQLKFGLSRRQVLINPLKGLGLMAVNVTGTVGNPQVKYIPTPTLELDDGIKRFLGSFDPRQMTPQQKLFAPRTTNATEEPRR